MTKDRASLILNGISEDEMTEFPISLNYEQVLHYQIILNESGILVLRCYNYEYTGGAHGMSYTNNFVFDLETGKLISIDEIFNKQWKNVLTSQISSAISQDEPEFVGQLTKLGYWENEIEPNENWYINREGIGFYYNQYEIAPYVMGVSDIFIPFSELEHIISKSSVTNRFK